jgi:regulator of protease activity HflC (stomatin/prohibitin superfamily)
MAQAAPLSEAEVPTPVDLDGDDMDLNSLPRFQRAGFHAKALLLRIMVLGAAVVVIVLCAYFMSPSIWRSVLANTGAALLLIVAGLLSAYWIAQWRCRAIGTDVPQWLNRWGLRILAAIMPSPAGWIGKIVAAILKRISVEIAEALWLGAVAITAMLAVRAGWNLTLPGATLGQTGTVCGGLALLGAFGLLVLERDLSGAETTVWPEARRIAQLVRAAIIVMALASIALFFSSETRVWPARVAVLAGLLPAAIAFELLLRAVVMLFAPRNDRLEPRLFADSLVARFLQWPPRPLHTLQDELRSRFGIDLRQNWAFAFMRRAFLPVLGVIALTAWLLTGVSEIRFDGRAIYERFGKPVQVFGPGLHAGLPWPFSRVVPVENGVVRELATSVGGDEQVEADTSTADGAAPNSANRLWDASHVAEKSQVIASFVNDRQTFQIVNMDVRFIYRIGLTDTAALAATYNSADVPALIRSTASRILVQDFASRTLDELLGEQRTELAADVGKAVQSELDRVQSGVEILATLIEAIHPPSGAANAYHSVQAAQITAQATIARERGRAAQQINEAQLTASLARDRATAAARETNAAAEATQLRFSAEQHAYRIAGRAFLLEQYLTQLNHGLADSKITVLDHRIGAGVAPTIDLRTFALPAAATRSEP